MSDCVLCGDEAIWNDYRPRKDLHDSKFRFTYTTPITCYERHLVCNTCFNLSDGVFFAKLIKNQKKGAENNA